jgi:hypothetical protein
MSEEKNITGKDKNNGETEDDVLDFQKFKDEGRNFPM